MNKELTYYPFQEKAIQFAIKHQSTFLAMEAGTGKTIVTCGVINAINPINVLVVCPAFLVLNWEREVKKWCPGMDVNIVTADQKQNAMNITGVTIISYDLMRRMAPWYAQFRFSLLVWDESHYCSHANSLRSKASRMLNAQRKICLSGTPIQNRTINLWHQLHLLDPLRWKDYYNFGLKYCGGKKESYGWDFSGSSNLQELNLLLRNEIMLIMKKADVLPELPEKIRQIIELPCDNYREILNEERKFYNELIHNLPTAKPNDLSDTFGESYADELSHMAGNNFYDLSMLATLRKKTAMIKIPAIVEHVKNLIYQGQKVVLFTHHHCMTDELRKHFPDALYADGRIKNEERDRVCYKFQHNENKQLLIAGIQALGVGVTLTAANVVVIAELPWNPSEVTQAEDRVARIGLQHAVLIQHLLLQGSIDIDMAHALVAKQQIINQIIK